MPTTSQAAARPERRSRSRSKAAWWSICGADGPTGRGRGRGRATRIVNVYSTTKGLTAICAHRLAGEGRLDLDAPVAKYWPEFAANGKDRITVHQLLNHRAGLPAIRKPLAPEDLYDWRTMTEALAAETPWWEPGTRHGYHALTFGFLVGEVIRRITGKSAGSYFKDEIAAPLGSTRISDWRRARTAASPR